jgi:hypothetical protein
MPEKIDSLGERVHRAACKRCRILSGDIHASASRAASCPTSSTYSHVRRERRHARGGIDLRVSVARVCVSVPSRVSTTADGDEVNVRSIRSRLGRSQPMHCPLPSLVPPHKRSDRGELGGRGQLCRCTRREPGSCPGAAARASVIDAASLRADDGSRWHMDKYR